MNDIDDRIRAALHAAVDGIQEHDLRPAEAPTGVRPARQTVRWLAPLLAAAAVVVAAAVTFAVTGSPSASHKQQPGGITPAPTPPVQQYPVTQVPTYQVTALPSPPPGSTTVPATPSPLFNGDEPLWPFASMAEAAQWEFVDGPNGHSPWHASAKDTALFFATGFLQFHDITEVTMAVVQANHAQIGVGYDLPDGTRHTASVINLVRYGDDNAPWEVVSAAGPSLSILSPAPGTRVTSPMTMAGRITGADENITVTIRTIDGGRNTIAPVAAGGDNAPWSVTAPFDLHGVLTVVASTGGHLTAHERFAVVGVTAGS